MSKNRKKSDDSAKEEYVEVDDQTKEDIDKIKTNRTPKGIIPDDR